MLTPDEFQALLSLINRCPMTPLEAMGLNPILAKLAPVLAAAQPPAEPPAPEEAPPADVVSADEPG